MTIPDPPRAPGSEQAEAKLKTPPCRQALVASATPTPVSEPEGASLEKQSYNLIM